MRSHGVQMDAWGGFAEGKNNLFSDPLLTQIGEAHGKTVAPVVLRWLIQRGAVTIPKSIRRERMEANLDVFDFGLTDEDMAQVATMHTGASLFFDHRDPAMVSWLTQPQGDLTRPRPAMARPRSKVKPDALEQHRASDRTMPRRGIRGFLTLGGRHAG